MLKQGKRTRKHLEACVKYRKYFLEKNGYAYCEVCQRSDAPIYQVHHIFYASRYPSHPNLHDFRNLVHICSKCHDGFHSGALNDDMERLDKERGLTDLFKD